MYNFGMNITEVLSQEEIERVTRRDNLKGASAILCQWLAIIAIFTVVAIWTNPLSILVGIVLLGGRQLGFGILQHECGHKTLFTTPQINQFVGDWLVSPPGLSNMNAYMRTHHPHHRLAGTHDDPDLPNYQDYPITRSRLKRKLLRDITGRTGIRTIRFIANNIHQLHKLDAENRRNMDRYIENINTMEQLTRIQINMDLLKKHHARHAAAEKGTFEVEVLGVRVGDFVLVTFPGELSVQIGLDIKKRSPHRFTFVSGCTNGYIYYTPTAEQLNNVGRAQEDSDCMVAPEWQRIFEGKVAEILKKL